MRLAKMGVALAMVMAGFMAGGSALADHRVHWNLGVYVGPGFGYYPAPYYYYPPYPHYAYYPYYSYYPYYPPVITAPSTPPVYVEQGAAPQAQPQQYWWYYCPDSKGYYPYVKECPGGWQRVSPQPPGAGGTP